MTDWPLINGVTKMDGRFKLATLYEYKSKENGNTYYVAAALGDCKLLLARSSNMTVSEGGHPLWHLYAIPRADFEMVRKFKAKPAGAANDR